MIDVGRLLSLPGALRAMETAIEDMRASHAALGIDDHQLRRMRQELEFAEEIVLICAGNAREFVSWARQRGVRA